MGRCRSKKTLSLCFLLGLVVSRCSCIKLCCPFVRGFYFIWSSTLLGKGSFLKVKQTHTNIDRAEKLLPSLVLSRWHIRPGKKATHEPCPQQVALSFTCIGRFLLKPLHRPKKRKVVGSVPDPTEEWSIEAVQQQIKFFPHPVLVQSPLSNFF